MSDQVVESGRTTVKLGKLSGSAKDLVRSAVWCGWRAANTPGGGVVLVSPIDRGQTINVPANSNIQEHRLRGWSKKVARYGDPLKVAVATAHVTAPDAMSVEPGSHTAKTAGADNDRDEVEAEPAYPVKVEPLPQQARVISEQPWLAKRGSAQDKGFKYESRAVIERKWSDGQVDYLCSHPGCGFTAAIPQRVARHYARSAGHPPVGTPTERMRTEPWEPKARSVTFADRAARLAREVAAALEGLEKHWAQFSSITDLAGEVAERIVAERDRRKELHEDGESAGPLTAEQVLERIRGLVDQGQYLQRLEENRELVESVARLEAEAEQWRERCEKAEAAREEMREEWNALTELIQRKAGPQ